VLRTLTSRVALGAALVLGTLLLTTLALANSTLTLGSLMQRVTNQTLTQRSLSDDFNTHSTRAFIEIQALLLGGRWDAQTEAERALAQAAEALQKLEADKESRPPELATDYQRLYGEQQMLLKALQNLYVDARQAVKEGPRGVIRMRPTMEAFDLVLEEVNGQARSVMEHEQQLVAEKTEAGVRQVLFQLATSLAVLFALMIAAVVLLRHTIVNPLLVLARNAHDYGAGKLQEPVRVTRDDELGTLQNAFATMIGTINRNQSALQDQVAAAEAARAQAEEAKAALSTQLEIVAEQREVIREMSVPVLPVSSSTLVMPLIGALDTARLQEIQQQALEAIERTSARQLLLDVTGVSVIDTHVAQGLLRTVQAGRLLGAGVVLIGVRPEVAQTLVSLGIELSHVQVARDLEAALRQG
jgi:rsbT co-antagonist protein RsbR